VTLNGFLALYILKVRKTRGCTRGQDQHYTPSYSQLWLPPWVPWVSAISSLSRTKTYVCICGLGRLCVYILLTRIHFIWNQNIVYELDDVNHFYRMWKTCRRKSFAGWLKKWQNWPRNHPKVSVLFWMRLTSLTSKLSSKAHVSSCFFFDHTFSILDIVNSWHLHTRQFLCILT